MKYIWALREYLAVLASLGLLTAACSPRSAQPLESGAPAAAQDSSAAPSGGSRVDQVLRGAVETAGLNQWTIDGQVVQVTPRTEIDDNIQVGDVVEAEVRAQADGTLWLSEVELAHGDDNVNDNANGSHRHDDDDDGDDDDGNGNANGNDDSSDDDAELTGVVEAMGPSQWTIDGQVVQVTPRTEIDDNIQVGDVVEAEVRAQADGTLWLSEVELAHGDDNVNDNANGNHRHDDDDDDGDDDNGHDDGGGGDEDDDDDND